MNIKVRYDRRRVVKQNRQKVRNSQSIGIGNAREYCFCQSSILCKGQTILICRPQQSRGSGYRNAGMEREPWKQGCCEHKTIIEDKRTKIKTAWLNMTIEYGRRIGMSLHTEFLYCMELSRKLMERLATAWNLRVFKQRKDYVIFVPKSWPVNKLAKDPSQVYGAGTCNWKHPCIYISQTKVN